MSARPIPIAQAAAELGKSPATLRRWCAQGAPTERPGAPGRTHGALVSVEALRRWRASGGVLDHGEWLQHVAAAMLAFHRERQHRLVGLTDRQAAAYLHDMFGHIARRHGVDAMPDEVALLEAIARQS